MYKYFLIPLVCLLCNTTMAQPKTDSLLKNILTQSNSPLVKRVVEQKDSFRLQVIYTQINRDKHNVPSFQNYYFNVDGNLYFNPASTVKLPLAFLTLEKLNKMHIAGVNKYTSILYDSSHTKQTSLHVDETAETGLPSLAHFIKKAFLVSDNEAYNRMYQFIGQQNINRSLYAKGYSSTRISRQFLGLSDEENRHTNSIRFLDKNGKLVFTQPPAYNTDPFYFDKIIKIGKGHFDKNDSLINEPIDFTKTNNLPLEELQRMLQAVLFPPSVPSNQRFDLRKEDYKFLYQYLSQFPSETNYPKYDSTQYYDSYVKFYFRSGSHQMPANIRVFNKVGWAYGFLIDVSYVIDFTNKVEFMLTSTVYVNSDGILNDNKYDYESTGWPFLYNLGQTIYQYELQRNRKYQPNLKNFRIKYEKRNDKDTRAVIKDVDN